MDRRTFLKTTTAAAAGGGVAVAAGAEAVAGVPSQVAAPAIARGLIEIGFTAGGDADAPVIGCAGRRLLAHLREALEDRCRIVVRTDGADADIVYCGPDIDCDPAFAFFGALAGSHGLPPDQLQAWLTVGGGQLLWDDLAAWYGTKPMLAGHTGPAPGLWARRALLGPGDVAGQTIAVGGMGARVAGAINAKLLEPVASQLVPAFSADHIVAAEWGSLLAGVAIGLPTAARVFYRGGIHPAGLPFVLHVRLTTWDRLSRAERVTIEAIAAQAMSESLAEAVGHHHLADLAITDNPALTVSRLPEWLAVAVDKVTADFMELAASGSAEGTRIRDGYLGFRRMLGGDGSAVGWA